MSNVEIIAFKETSELEKIIVTLIYTQSLFFAAVIKP